MGPLLWEGGGNPGGAGGEGHKGGVDGQHRLPQHDHHRQHCRAPHPPHPHWHNGVRAPASASSASASKMTGWLFSIFYDHMDGLWSYLNKLSWMFSHLYTSSNIKSNKWETRRTSWAASIFILKSYSIDNICIWFSWLAGGKPIKLVREETYEQFW